ncbi:LuxR C-terminal-related transcriptional regulator [Kibdelosporangium persicum]|uniref:helix-turn-helix transcriptional regulator n=1 Tax=Kibdelosporangium persicum TaxID=2698649 RepID=UPI0015675ED1|nr:LuxR C-terminal-related transcriptional regulator [Kibdelosporangium persicum]
MSTDIDVTPGSTEALPHQGDVPAVVVPGVHSPDRYRCPAEQAIQVAHRGIHRVEAVQLAERALSGGQCATDPKCVRHAVLTMVYAGDLMSAEAHCAEVLRRVEWQADGPVRQAFSLLRARIRYLTGDCAGARERLSRLLGGPVHPGLRSPAVAWLVEALVQRDELGRAEALLAEHGLLESVGPQIPDRAVVIAARAAVHLAAERFQPAVDEYLECGKQLAESQIVNPAVVAWRSRAALAALGTHRVDLALALAHDELLAARRWGSPAAVGAALHPVAMLQTDGRGADLLADAVRLLDVARARNEQIWALYDLGLMLHKREDNAAARAKLELAGELAGRGGNVRWSRRVSSALTRLLAFGGTAALTKQEARIARLAAAGHSNKQIAAKLCLTVRTVEFHLSGAYRKLGISGRRELGAVLPAVF